jgi:transposase-like protein
MEDHPDQIEMSATVVCPYCGETVTIELDVSGGAHQQYVQDCEVCCRPWQVEVRYTGNSAEVRVTDENG